jgi:RNA polymerase sigma-70 factor (ECF subfamily)
MDQEPSHFVFEDVAEDLSGPLRRYLERLVGDRTTADDLLQDTLLKIARALPGFEGRSSVKTWAFTIATRVVTDHFRRPQNRAQMVEIDETAQVAEAEIDQQLVIDEMSSCVREVIDSLPEDYRTALVLHDLEGQTAAEVAEIAGCSLPTAKIRIHRARQRLKQALDEECVFYRDEENVFRCDRKPSGGKKSPTGGKE